jgi:hypothetical protein
VAVMRNVIVLILKTLNIVYRRLSIVPKDFAINLNFGPRRFGFRNVVQAAIVGIFGHSWSGLILTRFLSTPV